MPSSTSHLKLLAGGGLRDQLPDVAPLNVSAEDVMSALRNFDRPLELARSPLASGTTARERAASVRGILEDAASGAFGSSPREELLRTVIRRGYLTPDITHEALADELFLSRSTYFRKLRRASTRIAEYLTWSPDPDPSHLAA